MKLTTPNIPTAVVEWLEANNPERTIKRGESLESAHRRGGFQDCIALLRQFHDLQRRTDLTAEELAMLSDPDELDDEEDIT